VLSTTRFAYTAVAVDGTPATPVTCTVDVEDAAGAVIVVTLAAASGTNPPGAGAPFWRRSR
jgi:hypothetical protein